MLFQCMNTVLGVLILDDQRQYLQADQFAANSGFFETRCWLMAN
jgi:hypothetical protein